MIKTTDLRIGNWINDEVLGNVQIHSTDYNTVEVIVKNMKVDKTIEDTLYTLSHFNPIPLTTEILSKTEFTRDGFGAYNISIAWYPDQFKILSFSGDYLFLREGNTKNHWEDSVITLWNKDIQKEFYLHEIQNLYADLTRNQLIVNL